MRTPTITIIAALRALANDIQSGDGVANAAISAAADRLDHMSSALTGVMVSENVDECHKAAEYGLKCETHCSGGCGSRLCYDQYMDFLS